MTREKNIENLKKEIKVSIKNVYGNELIYPECDKAKAFAKISGRKTISEDHIELIQSLGFEIKVVTMKWH